MKSRIQAIRKALRLSQREFGERIGVSRDVISNIEYGRVHPKPLLLRHICELYNVNAQWLETGEGAMFTAAPPHISKKEEEALRLFQALRPEFQEYALEQIRRLNELQNR